MIGDEDSEPVFSIPDLLPHLSRKVQRKKLIDSPERLDIVAGIDGRAVRGALAELGLPSRRLPTTEITAVPAAPPTFVGIDKARFKRQVVPGDRLTLHAEWLTLRRNIAKFSCRAEVDGKVVAVSDLLVAEHYDDLVAGVGSVRALGGALWRGDLVVSDTPSGTYLQVVTKTTRLLDDPVITTKRNQNNRK